MMRVLFVMPHLSFGGAERLAGRIGQFLLDEGHGAAVAVVTRSPNEASSGKDWFAPGCRIHDVADAGLSLPDALVALARDTGATSLVFLGRSPAFHALPALRHALPHLRIVSFQFNTRELIGENRLYAPFIDLVVAEGRAAAQALIDRGEQPARLAVISSGPDLAKFAAPESDACGSIAFDAMRRPTVGFVGRLDAIKGPDVFVAVCSRLRDSGATFVLSGDGPFAGTVATMIKRYRIKDRIAVLGRAADADMPALYRSLDIVVVPSFVDGRPLVVQEAQASGCAVVASSVGAIPDLIEHEVTGFLCEAGDIEGFAGVVAGLIADPFRRRQVAEGGRRQVLLAGGLAASLQSYRLAIAG